MTIVSVFLSANAIRVGNNSVLGNEKRGASIRGLPVPSRSKSAKYIYVPESAAMC